MVIYVKIANWTSDSKKHSQESNGYKNSCRLILSLSLSLYLSIYLSMTCIWLLEICGFCYFSEQYNLTGSLPAAILGKEFSWECSTSIPSNQTINAVSFYRNNTHVGSVGRFPNGTCAADSFNPRYDYRCVSIHVFSLIIPGDNMIENENNSVWQCQHYGVGHYRSSNQLLKIAGIYKLKTDSLLL